MCARRSPRRCQHGFSCCALRSVPGPELDLVFGSGCRASHCALLLFSCFTCCPSSTCVSHTPSTSHRLAPCFGVPWRGSDGLIASAAFSSSRDRTNSEALRLLASCLVYRRATGSLLRFRLLHSASSGALLFSCSLLRLRRSLYSERVHSLFWMDMHRICKTIKRFMFSHKKNKSTKKPQCLKCSR